MPSPPVRRLVLTALLVATLAGLVVHHGATDDENWPHPTGDQLEADYDGLVGERILLFGDVQRVDPEERTLGIHVITDAGDVAAELEIRDVDPSVEPGGTVQIYGVLEADRTMVPEEVVVVNRDRRALLYKHGASVAGGLLAVSYFFAHWRIDLRRVAFEPRRNHAAGATKRESSSDFPRSTSHSSTRSNAGETRADSRDEDGGGDEDGGAVQTDSRKDGTDEDEVPTRG